MTKAIFLLILFLFQIPYATGYAGPLSYAEQILRQGPLDPVLIDFSDKDILLMKKDIQRLEQNWLFKHYSAPETNMIYSPSKADPEIVKALNHFRKVFLKVKRAESLDERTTRVYVIGGSMEYFYFRARLAGIKDFMEPEQFRFLALSRDTFFGADEFTEARIQGYIDSQIREDLREGRDIVLIDSVSKGLSLSSTYKAAKKVAGAYGAKSKIVLFGIPEDPSVEPGFRSGGYDGKVGAVTSKQEYDNDFEKYGWAYYGFANEHAVEKGLLVPRYASNKYTNIYKDGFPITLGEANLDRIKNLLRENSVQNLIERDLFADGDEFSYVYNRLQSLLFYQNTKSYILRKDFLGKILCEKIF